MRINETPTFKKPTSRFFYICAVAVVTLALIVLVDYPLLGQAFIGFYALYAIWRLESRQVFQLAVVALVVMLGAIVVYQWHISSVFSSYAFLLLIAGVSVLVRELWHYGQALRNQREEEQAKQA